VLKSLRKGKIDHQMDWQNRKKGKKKNASWSWQKKIDHREKKSEKKRRRGRRRPKGKKKTFRRTGGKKKKRPGRVLRAKRPSPGKEKGSLR